MFDILCKDPPKCPQGVPPTRLQKGFGWKKKRPYSLTHTCTLPPHTHHTQNTAMRGLDQDQKRWHREENLAADTEQNASRKDAQSTGESENMALQVKLREAYRLFNVNQPYVAWSVLRCSRGHLLPCEALPCCEESGGDILSQVWWQHGSM